MKKKLIKNRNFHLVGKRIQAYLIFLLLFFVSIPINGYAKKEININQALLSLQFDSKSYFIKSDHYAKNPLHGLVIISEPHLDVNSQIDLYNTLKSLYEKNKPMVDLSLFLVEGAEGRFDMKPFSAKDFDKYFYNVAEGKLSGWELYAIENKDIKVIGVEEADTYRQQLDRFDENYNKILDTIRLVIHQSEKRINGKLSESNDPIFKNAFSIAKSDLFTRKELPLKNDFVGKYIQYSNIQSETEKIRSLLGELWELCAAIFERRDTASTRALQQEVMENKAYFKQRYLKQFDFVKDPEKMKKFFTQNGASPEMIQSLDQPELYEAAKQELYSKIENIFKDQMGNSIQNQLMVLKKSDGVYEIAMRRDDIMARQTMDRLKTEKKQVAVLFIGNFHIKGMEKIFRANNISYVFLEHSYHDINEKLYLERLKNSGNTNQSTMPPAPTNPIVNKEIRKQFITQIRALDVKTIAPMIGLFRNKSEKDVVTNIDLASTIQEHLKTNPIHTLSIETKDHTIKYVRDHKAGATGDNVYEFHIRKGNRSFNVIGKIVSDRDALMRDMANTKLINQKAEEKGYGKLYAEYLKDEPVEVTNEQGVTRSLVLIEKIEGKSLRNLLNDSGISQKRRDNMVTEFFRKTNMVAKITREIGIENLKYIESDKKYKQLYDKLKEKLRYTSELNSKIYTDDNKMVAYEVLVSDLLADLYSKDKIFSDYDNTFVYRDFNFNNCMMRGTNLVFIDSLDDVKAPKSKEVALFFKELALLNVDFESEVFDTGSKNQKTIEENYNKALSMVGTELNADVLLGTIANLYLYNFSDSKIMLKNEESLSSLAEEIKGLDHGRKFNLLQKNSTFLEKKKKNYLILNLIKLYREKFEPDNDDFKTKLEKSIEYYKSGFIVMNNQEKNKVV
jgi:hypothetical protein